MHGKKTWADIVKKPVVLKKTPKKFQTQSAANAVKPPTPRPATAKKVKYILKDASLVPVKQF